ncbi:SRPBCC family protein [Planomonospora parontospora]|uniref:SRPBCC family protein n=1 Tax=Planomonospora parontospora TaxID=58119 RepID=UPI00166F9E74|nr:SRPBCC family protein [Planomonospora parontospora]GGL17552.1 activator of HSP90 ATPase [Planomonospora parontospora subsp. antibiotica]GII15233.1 activator of HSP90 ATPase [Planomonospora parontospora subsp. antibiotica]
MTFTPYTLDLDLDIQLEREVDVPPALVWKAWTTPDLLTQWFAPKPYETPHCEIDLRPGGIFRTVMRSPEGEEFDGAGCYLEVLPEERLVWTSALAPGYRPQPGEMAFTAIIELQPTASGGTRYRAIAMHQTPEDNKKHADMGFIEGWGAALDQLVALAKTL